MPKLPSLTPQKIITVLEKKGFVLDRIKGSHRIYYLDIANSTFKITDIGFSNPQGAEIKFTVTDGDGDEWLCKVIKFKDGTPITIEKIITKPETGPGYSEDNLGLPYDPDAGIDLLHLTTQYPALPKPAEYNAANYPNAGIGSVNTLKITDLKQISYIKLMIETP